MRPENEAKSLMLALQGNKGLFWKVDWGALPDSLVRLNGTSDDLEDEIGPCWFVMEYQNDNDDVVTLRTQGNPSRHPQYLGLIGGRLIAYDHLGGVTPTFHAVLDSRYVLFQAINGLSPNAWLGRVSDGAGGYFIGAIDDRDDKHCRFTRIDPGSL